MQDLEKTLEKLGSHICDELCCHRDVERLNSEARG